MDFDDNAYDPESETGDGNPQWLTAWSYPTRVTPDLALRLALRVYGGSSIKYAALAEGISPKRLRLWLKWGEEAVDAEVAGDDPRAVYADLYVKLAQATGESIASAEQRVRAMNVTFWLSHHPEARIEWGGDAQQALIGAPPEPEPEVEIVSLPQPKADPATLRTVLKMLIDSGAASTPHVVDQDKPAEDEDRGAS